MLLLFHVILSPIQFELIIVIIAIIITNIIIIIVVIIIIIITIFMQVIGMMLLQLICQHTYQTAAVAAATVAFVDAYTVSC